MTRRNKIIYWIATIWLTLGMVSTGAVQISGTKTAIDLITNLGYPVYLITILGVWKFLGSTIVLLPGLPLLKEWAYAGFFFAMSGAAFSHIAAGSSINELLPSLLLLLLTGVSWYCRPANRKVNSINVKPQGV